MGLPATTEIGARACESGSASERSASEPAVAKAMRTAETAYITLRIKPPSHKGLSAYPLSLPYTDYQGSAASGRQIVLPDTRPWAQLERCVASRLVSANFGTARAGEVIE
jgi:hypothetical protein